MLDIKKIIKPNNVLERQFQNITHEKMNRLF